MQKVDLPLLTDTSLHGREGVRPGLEHTPEGAGIDWGSLVRTDAALLRITSLTLFLLTAWPLLLTEVPPYQDLPNHLAAAHILWNPSRYPEFVANGFLKTNAALFTWLYFVGKAVGLAHAARLFAGLTLSVGAFAYPRFLLEFGGRRRLVVGTLFIWPMIHNWFVAKGMLDFALGVPLSLFLLVLLKREIEAPRRARQIGIVLLSLATWYAHVFALLVTGLVVCVYLLERRDQRALARLVAPMLPASILTAFSLVRHWTEPTGAMSGFVNMHQLSQPWELLYNMWAEWCAGFTWVSITSLWPIVGGLWCVYRWRRVSPTFFSPVMLLVLFALYCVLPYTTTNWFHVNSRLVPYLWMALFLRLPDRIPTWMQGAAVTCAVLYSVGMGVDYVRLDADRRAFTAGIESVPDGARLLPLVFRPKETSENTRSLMHAWGHYVLERNTSAPLLFAHSRSFPLMYRDPPPARFNHLVLESFASTMGNELWLCGVEHSVGVITNDCKAEWTTRWNEFWTDATPRFDHVLMWAPPPHILEHLPATYHIKQQSGKLYILERNRTITASSDDVDAD